MYYGCFVCNRIQSGNLFNKCVLYISECVTLATVLSFFTGAEEIPPNGYGTIIQPHLNFNDIQPYPTASTCAIALTLPTRYYDQPYENFKKVMDTAMICHGGFGLS